MPSRRARVCTGISLKFIREIQAGYLPNLPLPAIQHAKGTDLCQGLPLTLGGMDTSGASCGGDLSDLTQRTRRSAKIQRKKSIPLPEIFAHLCGLCVKMKTFLSREDTDLVAALSRCGLCVKTVRTSS